MEEGGQNQALSSSPPRAVLRPRPPLNSVGPLTSTPPVLLPRGLPRLRLPPPRPAAAHFFVREIYKNGFLKRLLHNERKSGPLAKLMRTDRYWTVFSVHDDQHPFLELWHEPSEMATKKPQFVYPLALCQHISPSLVPADGEWTFVINFEGINAVAVRFACNSREAMVEWTECLRSKLADMGVINAKGNHYTKVLPQPAAKLSRNPMSPLPSPPVTSEAASSATTFEDPEVTVAQVATTTSLASSPPASVSASAVTTTVSATSRSRMSIVEGQDAAAFTTSIYLNQTPPATPERFAAAASPPAEPSLTLTSSARRTRLQSKSMTNLSDTQQDFYETLSPHNQHSSSVNNSPYKSFTKTTLNATSSVYLNKENVQHAAKHVTVIPINSRALMARNVKGGALEGGSSGSLPSPPDSPEHHYDAIFNFERVAVSKTKSDAQLRRPTSPSRRQRAADRPRISRKDEVFAVARSPPGRAAAMAASGRISRHLSDSRKHSIQHHFPLQCTASASAGTNSGATCGVSYNVQQRVRVKPRGQRSSSLGPLLDEQRALAESSRNTNSLESIDSNPRRLAASKADARARGAIPRRPLPLPPPPTSSSHAEPHSLPHHPRLSHRHPSGGGGGGDRGCISHVANYTPPTGIPPHIPLPGLTFHLSSPPPPLLPPQPGPEHATLAPHGLPHPPPHPPTSGPPILALREQQVLRLRQEIGHPAGVRLVLRRRDCQTSLALAEALGGLWVAGWRQRDFPVLYNAFHVGDRIVSVGGQSVRTASEFSKLVKPKDVGHVEIVIRRTPFARVHYLRKEVDGQPVGVLTQGGSSEIKEIVSGSPASQHGMTAKAWPAGVDLPAMSNTPTTNAMPPPLGASSSSAGPSSSSSPPATSPHTSPALVPWVITEVNGRPVSLLAKEGEAADRLSAVGRDVSVLVQPADFVHRLRKHLKSMRSYKDYVMM